MSLKAHQHDMRVTYHFGRESALTLIYKKHRSHANMLKINNLSALTLIVGLGLHGES